MTERLAGLLSSFHLSWATLLWVLFAFVLSSVGGLVVVGFLLTRLPADYFCEPPLTNQKLETSRGIGWWTGRILKTLLGIAVIVVGIVLSLPGVPGPGLLVILVGIMLTDFPQKRNLERWMVSRPGVLPAINRLRNRFGKPPMFLDSESII